MTQRLSCSVPYCRRTTAKPYTEWICGKHWRCVPEETKKAHRKFQRLEAKARVQGRYLPRISARTDAIWAQCKAAAIETAMGISA